ncbi:MAG: serine/threonine protein kinase, partial [Planctomycetes bacterium]|nr:serine/threonine protein kinase [Planctomycetota bacterium]
AQIDHTNVVRVLDLGERDGMLYLAMALTDGDALSFVERRLQRQKAKLPLPLLLRILADSCAGLHAAHELRDEDGNDLAVIHRDVSPQNILVSMEGVAKVIDFGIAKAKHRIAEETDAGIVKGKRAYMAPEQALGQRIDRRVDVWAIAAIAYRHLKGEAPINAASPREVLATIARGHIDHPLRGTPGVPDAVADVLDRALATEPD